MNTKTLPYRISIASPCHARWKDMGGDDRVRFCDHCRKNVYNLSALNSTEVAALLELKQGQLCARIYQRSDGMVLKEDCPVGIARQWRRLKMLVGGGVAVILMTVVNLIALTREGKKASQQNRPPNRLQIASEDALSKLNEWFNLSPTRTLGEVCITPTMGKIAVSNSVPPPPAKK